MGLRSLHQQPKVVAALRGCLPKSCYRTWESSRTSSFLIFYAIKLFYAILQHMYLAYFDPLYRTVAWYHQVAMLERGTTTHSRNPTAEALRTDCILVLKLTSVLSAWQADSRSH